MFSLVIRVIFGWMVILGVIKRKKRKRVGVLCLFILWYIFFLIGIKLKFNIDIMNIVYNYMYKYFFK